jgi:putative FmdB family regulatory protein
MEINFLQRQRDSANRTGPFASKLLCQVASRLTDSYNLITEEEIEWEKKTMPIYEYQCKKCSAHTEVMQKFTDKPLTKCRKCGGRLEKLISAPAIQFKGSGWYITDYAGKKPEKSEEKKSSESSASDSKPASTDTSAKKADTAKTKKAPASTSGD